MGHTTDSFGKPVFSKSPTQTVVDLQAAADFAGEFANVRVGTASERGSLTPGEIHPGMLWSETDTGALYKFSGSGWVLVWHDTGWQPLGVLATGWSVEPGDLAGYRVLGGVLYMRGRLNATAGAEVTVLTTPLPVGARPAVDAASMVGVTGGASTQYVVSVSSVGMIRVYKESTAILNIPLNGFPPTPIG